MPKTFSNLKVGLDEDLQEKLQLMVDDYSEHHIRRQSVDARRSSHPHFVYTVDVYENGEKPEAHQFDLPHIESDEKPIIVGAGPAGLFAALRLVERGISCVLLERGSEANSRLKRINRFWRYGEFDPENNVCFGEGGAGLYSDGKLITRIKSEHIPYVLNRLVQFGAPEEIEYLANPHVGSDRIRRVIPFIRQFLLDNGCEIYFDEKMTDLLIENGQVTAVTTHSGKTFHSNHVVLATGHSAEDIFDLLRDKEVKLEGKSFAMGLRIEHPQELINKIQHRAAAGHPKLGAANYKVTHHDKETGIGVYSFCMCPGGYTISSGTDAGGTVSNGMSNYNRNSKHANSAMVVTIDFEKWFGTDLWGGIKKRRELEEKAFQMVQEAGGTHQLPSQMCEDFLARRKGESIKSSSPSGVTPVRLDQLLPEGIYEPLAHALEQINKKMPGFVGPDVQLHGVETRTSCPLRIPRDNDNLQSVSHKGLYPTGEGAGYAGGITSAAVDGVRVAEAICNQLASQKVISN